MINVVKLFHQAVVVVPGWLSGRQQAGINYLIKETPVLIRDSNGEAAAAEGKGRGKATTGDQR